ncbi:DUF4019 domain-containing protein [Agarivorans sp. B2Z047]|uniref:DUF4019 domain-containing protein n=1 Tax=Agarivorans albus MKT 106 TaxID=1331007 RepID=R9PT55_AGAAL|nr:MULTISPECIES: DUF4019 domain-containing protein [Agarivorans]MPW30637.1 DUF4019 domain-containing protein [Agarivorans sp. B2Z047]UQN42140.1 DUF4019 domain-containing protein [Agarivorans sp. B2Z047]GAD01831.1 hypothetical protein AALB_1911 [Agarivorans albus MKT 106]
MKINKELKTEAVNEALAWLHLIDNSHYGKAYKATADYFRSQISLDELSKRITLVNQQVGETTRRTFKSANHICKVPNAPVGDYVVIEFELEAEYLQKVIETVTPVFENGHWKVCGYYVSAA